MRSKVILNIPHSGKAIPDWALGDMLLSESERNALVDFMTDKDVDRIWDFVPSENKQIATVSRLVVDTERYRDDGAERMSQKGMGLYYTHTPEGKVFRKRSEASYKKCLAIYDEYHASLERKVSDCIAEHGDCLILDCHSFHDGMNYTGYAPARFPDVCVGVNGAVFRSARIIAERFQSEGYSVKINEPFAGALVPLKYGNDPRVQSVMIELNRRIYDNASFPRIRQICKDIYEKLSF